MQKSTLAPLALFFVIATAPRLAAAGDSTWLLCKGIATHGAGKSPEKAPVVVSMLERRAADSQSRDLAVTLIYGDHINYGVIAGKQGSDAAPKGSAIKLTSVTGKNPVTLTGTAELATGWKTFSLTGSVDWSFGSDPKPTMEPFSVKLTCETLIGA